MKIKDITEGVGDWLARKAGERVQQQQDTMAANASDDQTVDEPTQAEPAPQNQRVLDPEVEILSTVDPVILKFNGRRYTRQPNGQWTKLGQTKPLDMPMQQFLSKELAKL